MLADPTISWAALLGLGAFHGVNPAMGWLFAVALGIQERRRTAVWRAMLPLALGHALAVAAAVFAAATVGMVFSIANLRWPVAIVLTIFGASRLLRHRHPRWAAMRVGMRGLTLWSFLMASAHGAGLMVVPVFAAMGAADEAAAGHCHSTSLALGDAVLATALHGLGYVLVTALVAAVVFEKVGVGILRKAWINLDVLWAGALIATGILSGLV